MLHTESRKNIGLLMGPTGSGKSAMALAIANLTPTVIINADAMQMVAALRVITARPTVEEEVQAEHALYGVLPADAPTSVAVWLGLVEPVIRRAWAEGKWPLLVGGTGMYLKALMDGLAAIPEIPEPIRTQYRDLPQAALYPALEALDPVMAARLKPGDTQRLIRALEVVAATGLSLHHWQKQPMSPLFPEAAYAAFALDVPRQELYDRLDQRFAGMMQQGALAEVEALRALTLPPDTPILRAHGVPELTAYLRGDMPLDAAIAQAQQHTRNYAKRQMTWIRNQMPGARTVHSLGDVYPYFSSLRA